MQRAAVVASAVGARMLSEIEEGSLEEILSSLRTNFTTLSSSDFDDAANHNYDTTDPDHDVATTTTTTTSSSQPQKPVIAPTTTTSTTTTKTSIKPEPRNFPILFLNELVQRHFHATGSATLSITGRYHELLYLLVAALIVPPNCKTVAIVDFEGRFDTLRLLATRPFSSGSTDTRSGTDTRPLDPSDLDHVHILRPPRSTSVPLYAYLAAIEEYMLYAPHKSRGREWWGTITIGSSSNATTTSSMTTTTTTSSNNNPAAAAAVQVQAAQVQAQAQVAVTAGWQGWLRVDRAEVTTPPSFWNKSAEEARREREGRQETVEEGGWVASSSWGTFVFGSGKGGGRSG
ncbi:hypothetical protein QBC32DRAFT_88530 [Pseudoneurospora amorphoporcata]|uniref:Uncharacterized protein n=1 Tax=Pseudoneurospora amorphoporcata TaxID=241081 RepID=A0AAN6P2K9_9PEZI|nr:hypothetical protein QBC32DRAFT_88530 [Pseudoneurospora amorphoporcata]